MLICLSKRAQADRPSLLPPSTLSRGCDSKIRPVPASGSQRAGVLIKLGLWCALTTGRSVPGSTATFVSPLCRLQGHMGVSVGLLGDDQGGAVSSPWPHSPAQPSPLTLGNGLCARGGLGGLSYFFLFLASIHPLPRCPSVGLWGPSARLTLGEMQAAPCLSPPVFTVCLLLSAPVFGYLGDRYSRKATLSFGILLWSGAGLSSSFISPRVGALTPAQTLGNFLLLAP